MRLRCDVEISNLNSACPSKPSRASIALGKKCRTSDVIYLSINTARNKNGDSYKIKNNVDKVFSKFIVEGKCTVRFKDPPLDVAIKKADPLQLKIFLNLLKHCHANEDFGGRSVPLINAVTSQQLSLCRQMTIQSRTQYPAVGKQFPSSLERLTIKNCDLKRIDSRIFNLYSLKSLNLGHNKIGVLPQKLNPKCFTSLMELHLMHNRLDEIPPILLLNLQNSLRCLDLSHNEITTLPETICEMHQLRILNCSYNKLNVLPRNIGLLKTLTELKASNNNLTFVPGSLKNLALHVVDFSTNNFAEIIGVPEIESTRTLSCLPTSSLRECSAQSILKNNVKYSDDEVPKILRNYLKTCIWSVCRKPCFENYVVFKFGVNLNSFVVEVVGGTTVPMEFAVCCHKCIRYCKQNGYLTM